MPSFSCKLAHLLLEHLDTLSQSRSTGLLAIVDLGLDVFDLMFGPAGSRSTWPSAHHPASLPTQHPPLSKSSFPFKPNELHSHVDFGIFWCLWFGFPDLTKLIGTAAVVVMIIKMKSCEDGLQVGMLCWRREDPKREPVPMGQERG